MNVSRHRERARSLASALWRLAVRLSILCIVSPCVLPCIARAQGTPGGLKFQHITVDQGLSQNFVYTIYHDSKGYMWFGTRDGLNKYDGYSFTCYKNRPFITNSIPSNVIRGICEDHDGALWIATQRAGLVRFDRATGRFMSWRHDPADTASLDDDDVGAIFTDRDGYLWVGTAHAGIYRIATNPDSIRVNRKGNLQPLHVVHYRIATGARGDLPIAALHVICQDARGDIWAGGDAGLFWVDQATGIVRHHSDIPALRSIAYPIHGLMFGVRGDFWIGSIYGLYHLEPGESEAREVSAIQDVGAIVRDSAGVIWIGGAGGVYTQRPGSGAITRHPFGREGENAVIGSVVLSIASDRTGRIWIGTDGGVNRVDHSALRFNRGDSLHGDYSALDRYNVRAILEDSTGLLWIGTAGEGVLCFDPRRGAIVQHLMHPQGKNSNFINTIGRDRSGKLCFGVRGGLVTQQNGELGWYHMPQSLPLPTFPNVWSIYEDSHGILWLGCADNVITIGPAAATARSYRHDPADSTSISYNGAWTVLEDHNGMLWLGTPGGLNRFDRATGTFTHYTYDPANRGTLSNNEVWVLFEDRYGDLWVGTWGGGLNKFDRRSGRFVHYMEENGLVSNTIHGILEDSTGNLWISSGGGISKLDPRTGTFTNFGVADGLTANEYNPNACCRTHDGQLLFGGIYGVTHFDPAAIGPVSSFVPPIVITSFRKLDSVVTTEMFDGAEVRIEHNENYCSFEFAALDYENPGRIRYAYMLDGLDRDWIYSGSRRYVAYTNLYPGDYTFRVKATNSDGLWNKKSIAIHIRVIPPFWKTWQFETLAAAMLAAGAFGWYAWKARRRRQLELALDEAREIERREIAAELHDGPLQDLYSLRFILEPLSVTAGDGADGAALERVDETLKKVRGSLRNVCGDLQLPSFECGLEAAIGAHAERLCESLPGMNLWLDLMPEEIFTQDVRRNLFRAYRSAINNVLKHAGATSITVRLRHDSRSVVLEVEDNGRGFRPPRSLTELMRKKHYGLLLIDAHARAIGGAMEMRSEPGKGALIRVVVERQKRGSGSLAARVGRIFG